MEKLTGKNAVVTGASSGIGAAIAKHLAREGANVVLAARRQAELDEVAASINEQGYGKALAVVTDVAKRNDIDALIRKALNSFGEIDIYVNNAGAVLNSKLQEGKVDEWDTMIDVNIKGTLYGINAVLSSMLERSRGHIVNISSVSGQEVAKTGAVYSATKFAVRALSMSMEKELARTGVRVTNISPGMVNTDIMTNNSSDRKPLEAGDIARAVVYAVTQPDYVNVNEITVRPV
ncbi:SDR family NAD(P)-dependent oxidoreductase [Virgibacillus dakarensis]|uniref:Oxidoreductase n=1 Tax=Lentibacillus populi TaxID=1827502 RepID=A0A9W5X680_9BACI|nr:MULTISPECIES: SDR family oxidoreductase [Bacillaceae]MBT2216265.1 SDR family oxidoreductase [Virgibacillus dakarensis]MTW87713.1 SDR family NAD(P)-dependent oxidoreductase [Virgibacillus dakarensis]GGB48861.1 putative oxidoreductase [Lentibacillus populi]